MTRLVRPALINPNKYNEASLEEERLEQHAGVKPSAEDSHVMLCGNMGMIREVSAALEARGMRKNRKQEPGHYTTEKYH